MYSISQNSYSQTSVNDDIKVEISLVRKYDSLVPKFIYEEEIKKYGYKVKSKNVKVKFFDIDVDVINKGNKPIYLWFWKCSYFLDFEVSNDYMQIEAWGCDHNYPVKTEIKPNEKLSFKLLLSQSIKFDYPDPTAVYGRQVKDTKIGLKIYDGIYEDDNDLLNHHLIENDKSQLQRVWSNPLELLDYKFVMGEIPLQKN